MSDRLSDYRERRDADRSPEPAGRDDIGSSGEKRRYVIQHHDASTEHWDLRLEHRGALLSWSVPKGPSTDPSEKRLAIRTEDHPIDYADFEGTIPDGEYGAGSVIVWDSGTWAPTWSDDGSDDASSDDPERIDERIDEQIDAGHLTFDVAGEKLNGGHLLQRFRDEDEQWLLIKRDDEGADARRNPTSTQPESVISGDTVEDIASRARGVDDSHGHQGGGEP